LSEAKITVAYEQYLQMCAIGKEEPGIFLTLKAKDDATTASLRVVSGETQELVCGDINIEVPDRVHIQEASLENLADPDLPFKILTIKGDKSHDLSNTCEEGLSFPEGKWPSLSLLTTEEFEAIAPALRSGYSFDKPFVCKKSSVQALVKIEGQQRYPAKIVITKLKLEGGEEKEGVAYIELPPPAWASAIRETPCF
jgi:hypothetical protein